MQTGGAWGNINTQYVMMTMMIATIVQQVYIYIYIYTYKYCGM
jgi:hypothetical protein